MHGFSDRTAWDTAEGLLAAAVRKARAAGATLTDLTVSNPTRCGFHYPPHLLTPLSDPAALLYDPDPRGLLSARQAVCGYYADHGAEVTPDQILLTTSTSEAYSFLFRLLANPGDAVLAPVPSYPLFDFLADLDVVRLEPYPLFQDFGWWIDFAELERRITPRTRAVLLVHPNNPTGHATPAADRLRLLELCARHGLALIVDEVFLDYGLDESISSFAAGPHPCLTFVVSGLSKVAALPQMKVGWLAAFGPEPERREALARLEVIADTFLSMNAPAQHALPEWLASRGEVQQQILSRVRRNLQQLNEAGFVPLPVEAGWSAIVPIPFGGDGSDPLAERLVREAGVIVHPGSFYGLEGRSRVVVSLLCGEDDFCQGCKKLKRWCDSFLQTS